ncbi:Holliday junction branch migration protein RuvA [soil metagenome]
MIAFVQGTVAEVRALSVVVQVGGLGLELLAPSRTLARCTPGAEITLNAHLVVREDSLTLYGFLDHDALVLFRHLLNVSGVGPKVALALLSSLATEQIADAVDREDAALLATAPGVGKRTGERIVVELKSKLPAELAAGAVGQRAVPTPAVDDAVEALVALGYRQGAVRSAVLDLASADPEAKAETLIRRSLARLR